MAVGKPKKLIELPRDYLIIMMEAGYVYLAMRRFQESLELFEGVCHLVPSSDVPRIAIGNVYAAQQKYDEALKEYRKAIKLEPQSALAHAHMGEVFLLQEKKDKGLTYINKALKLDPDGKTGDFAKALLNAVDKKVLPLSELNLSAQTETDPTKKSKK